MNVRLHFAERCTCNNTVGKRRFTIQGDGVNLATGFDIYKLTGAVNRALVVTFWNVAVTGGSLSLAFKAEADYPSIAGIEIRAAFVDAALITVGRPADTNNTS